MKQRESGILDARGRPFLLNSLEDPRMSLDDPSTWDGVTGGMTTQSGVRVNAQTAIGQPAIWRAITLLSGDVAKLPLLPYERMSDNGKRAAKQHAGYRLTRRKANAIMTAFNFRRTLMYHALIHGNGCAAIGRNLLTGEPEELLILDPKDTSLLVSDGLLWYITRAGDEEVVLPGSDVLHIMGLSHNGLWGHNVCEVFAEAFGLSVAAREFGSRFFGEGTQASGLLMVPGHFSEEKAKNTLAAWKEMQQGLSKSHRVALLQDGVKWQQLTIPPEAAQFLQTRQFEIREIANVFGLPPHKLGDDTRSSYNSLEQENANYIDESLDPWLVQLESQCDLKLLSEQEQDDESRFFEFNRNARLRTDAKTRSEIYTALFGTAALSPNDILRRENMPTIGPLGDRRFRPSNFVPLDAPAEGPAVSAEAKAKLRDCIIDRLDRLQRIEQKRDLSEKFYCSFRSQMQESLAPLVAAAWAVLAPGRDPSAVLTEFLDYWIDGRLKQIQSGGIEPLNIQVLALYLLPESHES